jgi:hypothetical protein
MLIRILDTMDSRLRGNDESLLIVNNRKTLVKNISSLSFSASPHAASLLTLIWTLDAVDSRLCGNDESLLTR